MTIQRSTRSSNARAVVSAAMTSFGLVGTIAAGLATAGPAESQDVGAKVYSDFCAVCHQPSGQGNEELYPPLVGSEWVTGDKGRLLRIILQGATGPMSVAGTEYNGVMPPWGATLQDAQIAAVATYIRNTWGNQASPVTTEEVAAVRAATAGRTTPWTSRELTAISTAEK